MQHQADLVDLAYARLALFETFCFPTMVHQTFRNSVLWIIRTDPGLPKDIQQRLLQLLKGYPNFFLIHDNDNDIGSEANFRHLTYTPEQVVSGNYKLLQQALQQAQTKVTMETILDADDGIHVELLERIYQLGSSKLRRYQNNKKQDGWALFCIDRHLEWRAVRNLLDAKEEQPPETSNPNEKETSSLGLLQEVQEDFCVTPGLTYALAPHVEPPLVFNISHFQFHNNMTQCQNPTTTACYQRLNEFTEIAAIRARTTASAGMRNMDHNFDGQVVTDAFQLLPSQFGMELEGLRRKCKGFLLHTAVV